MYVIDAANNILRTHTTYYKEVLPMFTGGGGGGGGWTGVGQGWRYNKTSITIR